MTAKDPAEKPTDIAGAAPPPQTNRERAWRRERQKPSKTGGLQIPAQSPVLRRSCPTFPGFVFCFEIAALPVVEFCSRYASVATVDNAIAAKGAGSKPGVSSTARRAAAISEVSQASRLIGIANALIGSDTPSLA
jgi:hypothetical protein